MQQALKTHSLITSECTARQKHTAPRAFGASLYRNTHTHIIIYIYICTCIVYIYIHMRERERETERDRLNDPLELLLTLGIHPTVDFWKGDAEDDDVLHHTYSDLQSNPRNP